MLAEYIQSAIESAKYEIIEDREPYYAEVRGLPGVWATGTTLVDCRRNLAEVVEGWILVRVTKDLRIPPCRCQAEYTQKSNSVADE